MEVWGKVQCYVWEIGHMVFASANRRLGLNLYVLPLVSKIRLRSGPQMCREMAC